MNNYSRKKHVPDCRYVSYMYVFFKNGDYLKINKSEIVDIKMHLYDNLILQKEDFSPVCESGYIKLDIKNKASKSCCYHLYNPEEFKKNRKEYIEKRLTAEGGIERISMFNDSNFSKTFFGDAYAEAEDGFLLIKYRPNPIYGASGSEEHSVRLGDVTKPVIEKILLDFENCDTFEIFDEEIEDIHLSFEDRLEWNSGGYARRLKDGFIKLRLDPEISWRMVNVYDYNPKKPRAINDLIRRLCGKKGEDYVDICHLYVTYDYAGYGATLEEKISIKDVRPSYRWDEEYDGFDRCFADSDDDCGDCDDEADEMYISGYAEKQEDGSIIISFGGDAESDTYKKWLS